MLDSKMFENTDNYGDLIHVMLKLPWAQSCIGAEPDHLNKTKCTSVQIVSKLGDRIKSEYLDVLDLGLHDDSEEVSSEAVLSMPLYILWSGLPMLSQIFRRLK